MILICQMSLTASSNNPTYKSWQPKDIVALYRMSLRSFRLRHRHPPACLILCLFKGPLLPTLKGHLKIARQKWSYLSWGRKTCSWLIGVGYDLFPARSTRWCKRRTKDQRPNSPTAHGHRIYPMAEELTPISISTCLRQWIAWLYPGSEPDH